MIAGFERCRLSTLGLEELPATAALDCLLPLLRRGLFSVCGGCGAELAHRHRLVPDVADGPLFYRVAASNNSRSLLAEYSPLKISLGGADAQARMRRTGGCRDS